MQKKAKSKLTDILFVVICLFGASYSFYCFWQSLNKSLSKNETPIATITFKYKTAQRKFINDLIWDRLRQESPVYEGDTIRTAPLSEATIYFADGNIMDLQENTMARLSLKSDGLEVDFDGGQIALQTSESTNGVKLKTGNSVVSIDAGSTIAANNSANEEFSVQVQDGTAKLVSENGELDLEAGKTTQFSNDGTITKNHLNVSIPALNQKYLNFTEDDYPVPFSWSCDEDTVIIATANDKDFSQITTETVVVDDKEATIMLPSGTHYWRITAGDEELTGKITIWYAPAPTLITPKQDQETTYRTKKPSIRFAWSETERATSYEFVIADNPQMENPLVTQRSSTTSTNVDSLEAGTYYWTVTPFYMMNNIGLAKSSEVHSFRIVQNPELKAPELISPENKGLVSTKIPIEGQEAAHKTIRFSWKQDDEAKDYSIRIWKEGSAGVSAVSENTKLNYFSVNTADINIENGLWYWQVQINDEEGNYTPSEVRQFYAIDSNAEQRTLFPPDNYRVAQSRSQDLTYNWKTNLPYETTMQVSTERNFNTVVFSETTTNTSASGRNLSAGTYYWRLLTNIGTMELTTAPKTLIVEGPISAPQATYPTNYTKAVIREDLPLEFKWNPVDGIDYYQIKLYKSNDLENAVVEQNFIEVQDGTVSASFNLWNEDETTYTWTIQGFREETMTSSRASSYIATNDFVMRKLRPISLQEPADNEIIDGVAAVKTPATMEWNSVDKAQDVELVIYSTTYPENKSTWKYKNAAQEFKMPVLYEGSYFWKVYAKTEDGYDISSKETRHFSITAIPNLAAPSMKEPASSKVFDVNYFVNSKEIKFAWTKVTDATRYILTITNKEDQSVLFTQRFNQNTTEYTLTDLSLLKKGNFEWTVEAQSDYNGVLFQRGDVNPLSFRIDLPEMKKTKVKDTGKPRYGTSSSKK